MRKESFLQIILFFIFRAYFPKEHVREGGRDTFEPRQCTSVIFDSLKYHIFSYILTRYTVLFSHLSKKFINGCRIKIVYVSLKKAKMARFGGKVGTLHLSYFLSKRVR